MKHLKLIALGSVATLALSVSAHGADNNFTSHYLVDEKPYENYVEDISAEKKLELRKYLEYQQREPCQKYREVPEGFVRDGCHIKREAQKVAVTYKPQKSKTLADYEIHFAFDSASIEPAAGNTINQIAREIKNYSPCEVTVAGHTDRAGSNAYNVALSKKRADAVSNALNQRGIQTRIIDEEAYGERRPAVETGDGVALRENRRVVVEFRK